MQLGTPDTEFSMALLTCTDAVFRPQATAVEDCREDASSAGIEFDK